MICLSPPNVFTICFSFKKLVSNTLCSSRWLVLNSCQSFCPSLWKAGVKAMITSLSRKSFWIRWLWGRYLKKMRTAITEKHWGIDQITSRSPEVRVCPVRSQSSMLVRVAAQEEEGRGEVSQLERWVKLRSHGRTEGLLSSSMHPHRLATVRRQVEADSPAGAPDAGRRMLKSQESRAESLNSFVPIRWNKASPLNVTVMSPDHVF